jgi:GNAT superfamily N-acetyltransferase
MRISAPELLAAEHNVSAFACGKPTLSNWLRTYALSNQAKGFTRVLVVHESRRVVGFYGLAPTAVPPAALSRSVRTGRPPDPVPCILLGQFAVDKNFAGRGIGSGLLRHALQRSVAAAKSIGGRAVIVRAIDKDSEDYWLSCGFIPSKDDPATLFRSMESVELWLAADREGK